MGRDLHRHMAHAVSPDLKKQFLKVQRERCRVRRLDGSVLPPVLDGPDHRRRDARRGPDGFQEIGRAGLPVGSGESRQGQIARRVSEKLRRQHGHCRQGVAHPHTRQRSTPGDLLHHRQDRPGRLGGAQKLMPVRAGAPQRDETRARPDLPGVVGESLDPGGKLAPKFQNLDPVQEPFRFDHVSFVFHARPSPTRSG